MKTFAVVGCVAIVGCSSGSIDEDGGRSGAGAGPAAGVAGATASVAASGDPGTGGAAAGTGAAGGGGPGGPGGVGPGGGGPGGGPAAGPLPPGNWTPTWVDDFDGGALDETRWATQSDSYSDDCRGNHPDHKLEYNLPQNVAVAGGILTITALRQDHSAPSGFDYEWTSGLITTGHACGQDPPAGAQVHPGDYLAMRAKLSGDLGMWPALWTWSDEVDVFEYHPDNPTLLEVTNHTGEGAGFYFDSGADLAGTWHWFGALLGADQIVWYLDGSPFFTAPNGFGSDGAALIVNLSVSDGAYHPEPSVDVSTLEVDSVRVFAPAP